MRQQSRLAVGRPGMRPGRRFAFRTLLTLTLLTIPATALAVEQPVVDATTYSVRGVTHQTVSLSALSGCPTYSGPNVMQMEPGGSDYQVPASAWALATVLSCGLHQPPTLVTAVWIQRTTGSFEAPLANQDLVVPSQFQDPNAQPLIANNGGAVQNTYFRPWRGGSDANASDEVTANGPLKIIVADNGQLLQVTINHHGVGKTSSSTRVHFGATVISPSRGVVSPGSLTWNWSFGDSASSTMSSPTHPFQPGRYPVSVLVAHPGAGEVGTATIDVTIGVGGGHGPAAGQGGRKHRRSQAPTGPKQSTGGHPGGPAGGRSTPGATDTPGSRSPSGDASGNPGSSTHHRGTPRSRRVATRQPRGPSKPRSSSTKLAVPVPPLAPVVSGLLISDVRPLPPGESPLVHEAPAPPAPAPPLRSGGSLSPTPALAGALCLAFLFAYGAARELRGQRGGAVRGRLT